LRIGQRELGIEGIQGFRLRASYVKVAEWEIERIVGF